MRSFSQSNFKNVMRKKKKQPKMRSEHEQAVGARGEEDGGREESKASESGFTLAG